MKKIIAAAVAAAFVAPAFAADVSVSGDVEFTYTDSNTKQNFESGDQDVTVTGSEELSNGMTVSASLEMDGSDTGMASDAVLTITSGAVTFSIGDAATRADAMFDEKSTVAEKGGEDSIATDENSLGNSHTATISISPAEGLTVAASLGTVKYVKAATAKTANSNQTTLEVEGKEPADVNSYAAQYSAAGFSVAMAVTDKDGESDSQNYLGASYTNGPIYVAYESIEGNEFDKDIEVKNLGASYDYGMGKVFVESGEEENTSDGAITETVAFGASYKLGGAVNLYIVANNVEATDSSGTKTDDDQTIVGVEYAF